MSVENTISAYRWEPNALYMTKEALEDIVKWATDDVIMCGFTPSKDIFITHLRYLWRNNV